ncbi:hypothetical protein Lal_00034145 [Lupinus albus]|nr:hypothetical protein Lal_00034145 [Lupinus albus]
MDTKFTVELLMIICCSLAKPSINSINFTAGFSPLPHAMGTGGIIADKWSMRILWACAIGSAVSLYMVAVERQAQNRARMLAEGMKVMELGENNGLSDSLTVLIKAKESSEQGNVLPEQACCGNATRVKGCKCDPSFLMTLLSLYALAPSKFPPSIMDEVFSPFKPPANPLKSPRSSSNRRERRKCPRWFVPTLSSKPSAVNFSLAMPADFAALAVLRKSLQAIITCHFPVSARALAAARPNPEEAPVTTTLPFLKVFLPSGATFVKAGVVVATSSPASELLINMELRSVVLFGVPNGVPDKS